VEHTVFARDGRRLRVLTVGPRGGAPVFFLHGTPGSRLGPHPLPMRLHHLGVRLIAYDRPGYGGSDRLPGRQVRHAAADVETIADALGIERFGVVGRSGGGPHALACAALLPRRVRRAAALVCLAPFRGEGLDWYEGMTGSNVREYLVAEQGLGRLAPTLEARAEQIRRDPSRMLRNLGPELDQADWRVVSDTSIRAGLKRAFAEAVRTSGGGWVDDVRSFTLDWGFDPEHIRVPIYLWHGAQDRFSPVGHTRWLATRIPGATLEIAPHAAHFSAMEVLVDVLRWIDGRAEPAASVA
jgi:pimeloyl-ACP methyl ester carboxylesterase